MKETSFTRSSVKVMRVTSALHGVLLSTLLTLFCGDALANDGPSAKIFELMQQEQDVLVTLKIPESGDRDLSARFILVREGENGTKNVFKKKKFDPSDAVEGGSRCIDDRDWTAACAGIPDECLSLEPYSDMCAFPQECADCDGDGLEECPIKVLDFPAGGTFQCEIYYFFEVTDHCVPAETTTYTLFEWDDELDWDDELVKEYSLRRLSRSDILVVDSGVVCGDSAGCSVVGVGSVKPGGGLVLLLLGVGLAGLRIGRRGFGRG
jgi:hypothetical protein